MTAAVPRRTLIASTNRMLSHTNRWPRASPYCTTAARSKGGGKGAIRIARASRTPSAVPHPSRERALPLGRVPDADVFHPELGEGLYQHLTPVGRERDHVGHHAAEREALGWVAKGVHEARLPVPSVPDSSDEFDELGSRCVEPPPEPLDAGVARVGSRATGNGSDPVL